MGRIRSIKPEFPQSEMIGRLSRDARLLFIQLWTVLDDDGRARASSRMLASLLYPYDDDAPALIDGWLRELEAQGAVRLYVIDGKHYLDVPKWLKHQKIDHPSKSKIPPYSKNAREVSRTLAPDMDKDREKDKDLGSSEEIIKGMISSAKKPHDENVELVKEITRRAEASEGADRAIKRMTAYEDARHELWGDGPVILDQLGVPGSKSKTMIGRWLKATGDNVEVVMRVLRKAEQAQPVDPIPWIARALAPHAGARNGKSGWEGTQEALNNLRRKLRAGPPHSGDFGVSTDEVPGGVPDAGGDDPGGVSA
jgi:hypothetical protein